MTDLDVYVRDVDGQVVGGLIGEFGVGRLSIHALWVLKYLHGAGVGTAILKAAENAAVKNGCLTAILETLSFQAPAFYEKRRYVRTAVVDYLGGSHRIFMEKRLEVDSGASDQR